MTQESGPTRPEESADKHPKGEECPAKLPEKGVNNQPPPRWTFANKGEKLSGGLPRN